MGRIYDATWGRGFSALYDGLFKAAEENGLRDLRRAALADARGRTLELGAGTGASLDLYPGAVTELVLAEPDPHMLKQLRTKVDASKNPSARIVEAPAEQLPFEDGEFDTVVFALVLCTVPNAAAAAAEARRVLKSGGKLLFLEHVRAEEPGLARWQDRLEAPWRFVGDGCHCNRDTIGTLRATPGLELGHVEHDELPKAPPIVRPLVWGSATAR